MRNPRILTLGRLRQKIKQLRKQGKSIVLTNGCFDLLHAGHLSCLQFAGSLGDILIVAVNSDASVRRLKGISRPIFPAGMRMELLSELRPVDYVVSFGRDNAVEVVRAVRPDIYVKSEEYNLPETPEGVTVCNYGGKVVAAPLVPGISTTGILEQIYSSANKA